MHGYIEGEIKDGRVLAKFVPFAMREYVHMRLEMNDTITNMQLKEIIKESIRKAGNKKYYKIILSGFRNTDIVFDVSNTDPFGNILEIADETKPAYRFEELREKNKDNLLGKYMRNYGKL